MDGKQTTTLVLTLMSIGGLIYYLESHKPGPSITTVTELTAGQMPMNEKEKKFVKAKELVSPKGFIN